MEEDGARVVNKRTNFALWKRARSREGRGRRQESARDCVGMVLTLRYLSALDVYRILNMLSSPGEPISGAARYGKFGVEAGGSSAAEVSLQRPDGALRETVVWSGGFTTRVRSTRCDGATDCPAGSGSDCSNSRQKQQGAETAELDETGGIKSYKYRRTLADSRLTNVLDSYYWCYLRHFVNAIWLLRSSRHSSRTSR